MKFLPTESLDFSNRIRKHFDQHRIEELATSIQSKGLMHALVVTADGHFIAGERRFRAMARLHQESAEFQYNNTSVPPGHYPCVELSELSESDRLEAELEENVLREDLTWTERAAAEASLHTLRVAQRGAYHRTHNPDGQSIATTAAEITGQPGTNAGRKQVSDSLILARHLDDPEISGAPSKVEALKLLRAKAVGTLTGMLADRASARSSRHTIIHGSCLDFTGSEVFDCILTDPPYGINAGAFGNQTSVEKTHDYDDSPKAFWQLIDDLLPILTRAMKPQAHLYMFVSFSNFLEISTKLSTRGLRVWPRPLIWAKGNQGLLPDAAHGPRYTHDYILYALKGNKPVERIAHDVINEPQAANLRRSAEKPVALYTNLLYRSCVPGSHVWDPFCGSGPIFPAANHLKLVATGHDIDEDAINIAKTRLEEQPE